MRKRRAELQEETRQRFQNVYQFFGGHFHEDRHIHHGSVEDALAAAIADSPVALRQEVRRELASIIESYPEDPQLAKVLNDCLGVNVHFGKGEARAFAERAERELLTSIKAHFDSRRAPGAAGQ